MFGGIGMQEMLIIGIIAVILFGKKLPEVARSLGGSYREFKKGLVDFQSNINEIGEAADVSSELSATRFEDDYEQATAPKFEPPSDTSAKNDSPA